MQFAKLKWNNQEPYSLDFNDVYYSSDDGLAETNYVFIQHNQLSQRFAQLEKKTFNIIETGFGTGLNFFCATQHFLAHAPKDRQLRFTSIERYPLSLADFTKANHYWFVYNQIVRELADDYAQLKNGYNTLSCCDNRIQLNLWIGDVNVILTEIESVSDAWFLDGFAPAKNADMWSATLFNEITRLSQHNTTFATFTSASEVRRQLQAAGFQVKKAAGFGKKREMLYGIYR